MQKNDLVKEIDRAIERLEYMPEYDLACKDIQATLQRAREALSKAQDELLLLSEQVDHLGHPIIARQLLDIRDTLTYTPEES